MPQPVTVRMRDCACPHAPHADGDTVLLRPTLSLVGGIKAQQDVAACRLDDGSVDVEALVQRLMSTYVRFGVTGWNLTDEDGLPVALDIDALLDDFSLSYPIANAADDLYAEAVLLPLGLSRPPTSPRGRTAGSTSRTPRSKRTSPASP